MLWTALHHAAARNQPEAAEALITSAKQSNHHEAVLEAKDRVRKELLLQFWMLTYGCLREDASRLSQHQEGHTPVHVASSSDAPKVLRELLSSGGRS